MENKIKQNKMTNETQTQNSFIPTLRECERFILFLNEKFKLNLPQNYTINITENANKNILGYYRTDKHQESFLNANKEQLKSITLSSYHLNKDAYETITHELAHLLNDILNIRDCSSNQYHNKHFKKQAEKLFLNVEKSNRGYAHTSRTEQFNKMMEEFKPNEEAFKIFQQLNPQPKKKKGTRLFLYECKNCNIKIRSGLRDLNARCNLCEQDFKWSVKNDE